MHSLSEERFGGLALLCRAFLESQTGVRYYVIFEISMRRNHAGHTGRGLQSASTPI